MNHEAHRGTPNTQPQYPPEQIDYTQPVAYDTSGRPLYAHPPQPAPHDHRKPQIVQLSRPLDPVAPQVSEEVMERHWQSVKAFPELNLSEGEYVIQAVRRHPIGLVPIFTVLGVAIIFISAAVGLYASLVEGGTRAAALPPIGAVALIALLLCVLLLVGGFISVYVYLSNRFFLTNESVIQEIRHSVFSRHEQTVSLANIEDASFRQEGVLQHMLNYGSIRLSTQGDETTYRFNYVSKPKEHIAVLNNAVEAFKNGRPVIP